MPVEKFYSEIGTGINKRNDTKGMIAARACRLPRAVLPDALTSPRESRARETAKTLLHGVPTRTAQSTRPFASYRRSPSVGNTQRETAKRRYGLFTRSEFRQGDRARFIGGLLCAGVNRRRSVRLRSPQEGTVERSEMPAQDPHLEWRQRSPIIESLPVLRVEQFENDGSDLISKQTVRHDSPHRLELVVSEHASLRGRPREARPARSSRARECRKPDSGCRDRSIRKRCPV